MALVAAMHITAGVWVNDDEPGLHEDTLEWLDKVAPPSWKQPANDVARELLPDPGDYRHHRGGEDNGDAHLKNLLVHHQVIVPVTDGRLDLGPWQQVFYARVRRPPCRSGWSSRSSGSSGTRRRVSSTRGGPTQVHRLQRRRGWKQEPPGRPAPRAARRRGTPGRGPHCTDRDPVSQGRRSRSAGARRICADHVRAQLLQRRACARVGRADRVRPGPRLRRLGPAPRRDVGVPDRQHVRRRRVHLLRRVLDLVLAFVLFFAEAAPGKDPRAAACGRAVPDGVGDLHRLHVHRVAAHDRGGGAGVPAAGDHVHRARHRQRAAGTQTSSRPGGYIGIATAVAAWYASFAAVVNSTFGRTILPVVPLGAKA